MSKKKKSASIGIVGFPGLYAGANVELDNQLTLWHEMGYDLHLVPTGDPKGEALLNRTMHRATVHGVRDYEQLTGMPVIAFCNDIYLRDLEKIKEYAATTIWVNCMSWLFEDEKNAHQNGLIDRFVYQTERTQEKVGKELSALNSNYDWKLVRSYFDDAAFPFHANRPTDKFRFGRISREDADKYAQWTFWLYETMVAPVLKDGVVLGFGDKVEKKLGKPPDYIRAYPPNGITQQEFYAHSSCVIQPADTFENWPRVGMEAMASGSVLIVDDRGGWQDMVVHGDTGWLCKDQRDFAYYSSRMAYEVDERERMAQKARQRARQIFSKKRSMDSWREIFEC